MAKNRKRTKIVATLGPACSTKEIIEEMMEAGVNVFRVNFSHAEYDDVANKIKIIREINKRRSFNVAILVDLQGKNDIHYVDLRITNKCNLRCRMCVPQSSILLARDMKELGYNVSPEELRNAPAKDFDSLISELGPKLDNLKIVYLAGGEPSIMDEQYMFIDYLIEKDLAKNIKLYCTSNINLRTLKYGDRDYIELLKNFKQVLNKPIYVLVYGVFAPPIHALLALLICKIAGVDLGETILLMILSASASYIAVPAALKYALPQANPSLYFGMSLGLTFPINIIIGIPLYTFIAKLFF